jgi:hypothetical protein
MSGGSIAGARKGAFDFGFTKLEPVNPITTATLAASPAAVDSSDEEDDEVGDIDEGGMTLPLSRSSSSGKDNVETSRGRDRSRSRDRERSRSRSRSRSKKRDDERIRGREREEKIDRDRSKSAARERMRVQQSVPTTTPTKVLERYPEMSPAEVVGSVASNSSDWISATDSPAPKLRESGLSQVVFPSSPDRTPIIQDNKKGANGGGTGRATFQLVDVDVDDSTPPSPQQTYMPPPPGPTTAHRHPPRPASPPLHSIPSPVILASNLRDRDTIEFPTLPSAYLPPPPAFTAGTTTIIAPSPLASTTTSPVRSRRPTHQGRKLSSTSLMSMKSTTGSLSMGPPSSIAAGGLRRTSGSIVQPTIDRGVFGVPTLSASASSSNLVQHTRNTAEDQVHRSRPAEDGTNEGGRMFGKYSRSDSVTSLRSIAESSSLPIRPGRAPSVVVGGGGGGAIAALSNASHRKNASGGYFSNLRERALGSYYSYSNLSSALPDSTPSASPPPPSSARIRLLSSTSSSTSSLPLSSPSSPPPSSPATTTTTTTNTTLISKFIEPLDPRTLAYLATPPAALRALPPHLTAGGLDHGHSGLINTNRMVSGSGGRMIMSSSSSSNHFLAEFNGGGGGGGGGGYYTSAPLPLLGTVLSLNGLTPPLSSTSAAASGKQRSLPSSSSKTLPSTSTNNNNNNNNNNKNEESPRSIGMQKWAAGLIREAERIERSKEAVEKWRDPLGESLKRVLG